MQSKPSGSRKVPAWAEGIPVYPDSRYKNDTTHTTVTIRPGALIKILEANRATTFETTGAGVLHLRRMLREKYLNKSVDAVIVGILRGRDSVGYAIYVEDGFLRKERRVLKEQKECRCGCGRMALPGRRYINGHSGTNWRATRNTHLTSEQHA